MERLPQKGPGTSMNPTLQRFFTAHPDVAARLADWLLSEEHKWGHFQLTKNDGKVCGGLVHSTFRLTPERK